jgi:glycosyltransferase involved in cell wall biosynthesis
LIGTTNSELIKFNALKHDLGIKKNYLDFKPHVKHSQALRLMQRFDILILPAYSSNRYVGMPLKLLEYLSTGKIVVVADSPLYRGIFKSRFNPFYYVSGDVYSLEKTINSAMRMQNLYEHLVSGVSFASNYSWTNRTLNMINVASRKVMK